jgi:predicted nucleic acid-binding Zn ribbon protein
MTNTRQFRIRRTFVLPLGLLILLTLALLLVCFIQQQPIAKTVILSVLLLPLAILFIESVFRRLEVDSEEVTAHRLFKTKKMRWADVTGLESVKVRSRVFLTLVAGEDFLIISNSYGDFPFLLKSLVESVPEGTVTEETKDLLAQPPKRQADVLTAWFAVIALVYVLLAQFKP